MFYLPPLCGDSDSKSNSTVETVKLHIAELIKLRIKYPDSGQIIIMQSALALDSSETSQYARRTRQEEYVCARYDHALLVWLQRRINLVKELSTSLECSVDQFSHAATVCHCVCPEPSVYKLSLFRLILP